jgi:hypothetical protein
MSLQETQIESQIEETMPNLARMRAAPADGEDGGTGDEQVLKSLYGEYSS